MRIRVEPIGKKCELTMMKNKIMEIVYFIKKIKVM